MKKILHYFFIVFGCLIILIEIYGFFLLRQRPGLPKDIEQKTVCKINDTNIQLEKDIEFILGQKSIGDKVSIQIQLDGRSEDIQVTLQPYYANSLIPVIYLLIGLFSIITGIFVYSLRPKDRKARVYYLTAIAFSFALIISSGYYFPRKDFLSYIPGILYFIFYPLVAALLLHFSFQFTHKRWSFNKSASFIILYSPAFIFAVFLVTVFLLASLKNSVEIHRIYLKSMYVFRGYIIIFVSLAIGHLIRLFKKSFLEEQRAQIKWALCGLTLGVFPFILLYQLPMILKLNPLLSEELSSIFFIFIPIAFAISILKYKLMNIELVINKGLVYTLLTVFTVCVYLLSVQLFQNLVTRWFSINDIVLSGLAALVAASTFHPARNKIQKFVDKSFFRLSYDYKKSILSFIERVQNIVKPDQLIDFFLLKIDKILPTEKLKLVIYTKKDNEYSILFRRHVKNEFDSLIDRNIIKDKVLAKKSSVQTEEKIDFTHESILEKNSSEAIIPLSFQMTQLTGILSLGKKRSGTKYSSEDLELLQTLSREFSLNLERIRLQEEVFLEKAEIEKLTELNRLRTEFVSMVSHEIRTPMSSIQGLSEILKEDKIQNKTKRDELLDLITNECTRLSRFLHNILDFGRIEKQTKQYNFEKTEIKPLVEETLKLFKFRLDSGGFKLITQFPQNPIFLSIDRDAVIQSLINLIDNAINYSQDVKEIGVYIQENENSVEIQITDKGLGIPENMKEQIFESFFRTQEALQHSPKGVGIGLKIVKHIMDAHKGQINVQSQPGKGSTFSLIFPRS